MGQLQAEFDDRWVAETRVHSKHISRRQFISTEEERRSRTLAEDAAWRFAWEHPQWSAHSGISPAQKYTLFVAIGMLAAGLVAWPLSTILALKWAVSIFFGIILLFRLCLLGAGIVAVRRQNQTAKNDADRTCENSDADRHLPIYTILSPLYREPDVVPQLIAALSALDYPADKLDIKLVLEADDILTLTALEKIPLPEHMEVLRVPPVRPRTKPKACNYALEIARGDFLVIYDAEDLPEPDQLRKAVAAFSSGGDNLACLQARLNYYNPRENWLTRQFTLEYTMWFDVLLPGLETLKLPIPLGGTSNHFRSRILRQIGGWDPYNVTEDADLGLRLARRGYHSAVLDSTTFEEANCRYRGWLRQRTRWLKGYMLTWLVHMREPATLWRQLGPRGFFGFQLFVGGTVWLALAMPLAIILMTAGQAAATSNTLWILQISLAVAGSITVIASATIGAMRRGNRDLLPDLWRTPAYWALTMAAGCRALWQLFDSPFRWEKTRHGVSNVVAPILQVDLSEDAHLASEIPPA